MYSGPLAYEPKHICQRGKAHQGRHPVDQTVDPSSSGECGTIHIMKYHIAALKP